MSMQINLGLLEVRGLIRVVQTQPDFEYLFKHSLVQESAYRSLLREERRELHRMTGQVLERVYAESRPENAPRLAHHFSHAGDYGRAYKYFMLAGDQALRVHAYSEAVEFFERALESAEKVDKARADRFRRGYERLGRSLELADEYPRALECYQKMESRSRSENWPVVELAAQVRQATIFCTPSPLMDRMRGIELSRRTLKMSRGLDEVGSEILSHRNLSLALALAPGKEAEALIHGEEALKLAEDRGQKHQLTVLNNDVGRNHMFCGNARRAQQLLDAAEKGWREQRDLPMLVDCLVSKSALELFRGELEQVGSQWQEAVNLAERTGNPWALTYSQSFLDAYHLYRGEFSKALKASKSGIEAGITGSFKVVRMLSWYWLGEAYLELGQPDLARLNAEKSAEEADSLVHNWLAQPQATMAKLWLDKGNLEKARSLLHHIPVVYEGSESCFHIAFIAPTLTRAHLAMAERKWERALEIARRTGQGLEARGLQLLVPDSRLMAGRALLALGQAELASDTLRRGADLAEEMGALRIAWRLMFHLAEAEERLGRQGEAERLRSQAASMVETLAQNLEDTEHRGSFLARPDVEEVLKAV